VAPQEAAPHRRMRVEFTLGIAVVVAVMRRPPQRPRCTLLAPIAANTNCTGRDAWMRDGKSTVIKSGDGEHGGSHIALPRWPLQSR